MNEIFINKARAVAITGHRMLCDDFNKKKLKELLTKFVDKGFNIFLVGMALGFDTVCFQTLEEIRKEHDLDGDSRLRTGASPNLLRRYSLR